jgi:hypothetical protein
MLLWHEITSQWNCQSDFLFFYRNIRVNLLNLIMIFYLDFKTMISQRILFFTTRSKASSFATKVYLFQIDFLDPSVVEPNSFNKSNNLCKLKQLQSQQPVPVYACVLD